MLVLGHVEEAVAGLPDQGGEVVGEEGGLDLHLLHLPQVQELVGEVEEAVGVLLHRQEFLLVALRVISAGDDLVQRHLDEGERGADLVGDVREEVDLRVIEFLLRLGLEPFHLAEHLHLPEVVPLAGQQEENEAQQQDVQDHGDPGHVERRHDFDFQLARRASPGADSVHAELVSAR